MVLCKHPTITVKPCPSCDSLQLHLHSPECTLYTSNTVQVRTARADMEILSVNELGLVQEESFNARTKWYDLGLMLKVPVNSLDSIRSQFEDKSEQLREMLKSWLKSTHKPSWVCLVNALRCQAVGEMKLAEALEEKYCSLSTNVQGIRENDLTKS